MRVEPVFLFDLDGTLIDSVYQHVLAWKEALDTEGIALSVWRIPCWQQRAVGRSLSVFCVAATARTNCIMPELSASMRILPTFCATSTRWAGV